MLALSLEPTMGIERERSITVCRAIDLSTHIFIWLDVLHVSANRCRRSLRNTVLLEAKKKIKKAFPSPSQSLSHDSIARTSG